MVFRELRERGVVRLTGYTPTPTPLVDVLKAVYPVGAYFISHVPTAPSTLFGFGTWSQVAKGKMLIGVDETGDADWNAAGDTGGEKDHTLTIGEMPAHDHNSGELVTNTTGSGHQHNINRRNAAGTTGGVAMGSGLVNTDDNTGTTGSSHTHGIAGSTADTGGGNAHNNMPPFLAAYIWRRTA